MVRSGLQRWGASSVGKPTDAQESRMEERKQYSDNS